MSKISFWVLLYRPHTNRPAPPAEWSVRGPFVGMDEAVQSAVDNLCGYEILVRPIGPEPLQSEIEDT
jgi:hypothetical protein